MKWGWRNVGTNRLQRVHQQTLMGTWNTTYVWLISRVFSFRKNNILFVMSLRVKYIHLFHKHDWRHVIDTAILLYMIVGPQIRHWSQYLWLILKVNIALSQKPHITAMSKGALQKGKKSELRCNVSQNGCIWFHALFNYFLNQSFVHSGMPSHHLFLLWRQGDWSSFSSNWLQITITWP